MDKLDGRITSEFFDQRSAAWRDEQDALLRKIQDVQKATPAPIDQAINLLQLTSRACGLFTQQPAAEQRRLLQVVIEKAAWQDGALRTTLFELFEILRHSNQESHRKEKQIAGSGHEPTQLINPEPSKSPPYHTRTHPTCPHSLAAAQPTTGSRQAERGPAPSPAA